MLVIFDLPVTTKKEQKAYREFRAALLSSGYIAVQKSVYAKLLSSSHAVAGEERDLEMNAPAGGQVFALPMSLLQFQRMIAVSGQPFDFSFFADDVICISA